MNQTVQERVATQDEESFESFFRAQNVRLFQAALFVTRDRHEAEDVTQESFLKVLERWDYVSKLERPEAYLHRIAMNEFLQRHRRARRSARRLILDLPKPEDPFEPLEMRDALQRALLRLPIRQRAALVLMDFLGYDSSTAASQLGIRAGTVRRLASQARSRIRENDKLLGESDE